MNYKKITLFITATVILLILVSCTNTNDKNTNKQIINSNVVETNDEYTNKLLSLMLLIINTVHIILAQACFY